MDIVCLDLEGVLIPEIWVGVAERTGIAALKATTREIPDYDRLMKQRLALISQHGLKLDDVQDVVSTMQPLEGAGAFLGWLRERFQVMIISDTFYEFAMPFMRQLDLPTLLCHRLEIDATGFIVGYRLRQEDPKRRAVQALRGLNFRVLAAGDSYNDIGMLGEADLGVLYRPPENIRTEYPRFAVAQSYAELQALFAQASCVQA
ncbi:MAG: bifunctional phosphoserine phosphatase/homoserine phosphotransferase ThrH [Gammaproteobacteria bacterium]